MTYSYIVQPRPHMRDEDGFPLELDLWIVGEHADKPVLEAVVDWQDGMRIIRAEIEPCDWLDVSRQVELGARECRRRIGDGWRNTEYPDILAEQNRPPPFTLDAELVVMRDEFETVEFNPYSYPTYSLLGRVFKGVPSPDGLVWMKEMHLKGGPTFEARITEQVVFVRELKQTNVAK